MSISNHLFETPEDLEVKRKLWRATEREVMGFAQRYADLHAVGSKKPSDGQKDIAAAAKKKGYPKTLIYQAASIIRRKAKEDRNSKLEKWADVEMQDLMKNYADNLGLGRGVAAPSA